MSESELLPETATRLVAAARSAVESLSECQVSSVSLPTGGLAGSLDALASAERHAARSTALVGDELCTQLEHVTRQGVIADGFG